MKFKTSEAVANVVYYLKQADLPRSGQRAQINELFNGSPPYTESEASENNIDTNVNFLDAPRVAYDARATCYNAFLKPGNYFAVSLDGGPAHKRSTWSRSLTKRINRLMKRSKGYTENLKSEFAQTVLHGVGPSLWDDRHVWSPTPVAIDDLLIPSRTRTSMDNLEYFAVYRQYTPAKLYRMTHGKVLDPGWNMKVVNGLLKKWKDEFGQAGMDYPLRDPEKLAETMKADLAYFDNEATPTINCWDFYYLDDESEEPKWNRRMITDSDEEKAMGGGFLYEPKRVAADELSELLHVMFMDGANVAPFRYHSVRGLGWLLYAVCHLQNRLRCKFNDSVFEQLMWYFRVENPEDRERVNKIDLHHLGIIPPGVDFIKAAERYQPNPALINNAFAVNRQSILESSGMFKADLDQGGQREMTAQEVMARMNTANALVGSMLNFAYNLQLDQYREVCRRFCRKGSLDKDVKKFQEECSKDGIPTEMLDVERWDIEPERVLGSGNKTLEIAQAQKLLEIMPMLDPAPQREVLHIYVEAMSDNPEMAERLVPINKKVVSDAVHDAQLAAGSLMQGMPVSIKTGTNHVEYVEALLVSTGAVLQKIQSLGGQTDLNELTGLQNMLNHINQHIAIIAQNKHEGQRVKRYSDAIGQFTNIIEGLMQQTMEKMQSEQPNGQVDPAIQAKIAGDQAKTQSSISMKEASAQQRLQQKDAAFQQRQRLEAERHRIELGKAMQSAEVEVASKDLKTAADIRAKALQASVNQPPQS